MTQKKDSAKELDLKEVFSSGRLAAGNGAADRPTGAGSGDGRAQKSERTAERLGYRSGYYTRTLETRVGKLMLRVPQDRQGTFRREVFERYQRSEKALVATLAEMFIQDAILTLQRGRERALAEFPQC